jgi:hypothetical protein
VTIERRFVVGLDDIKSIVFECYSCKARLAISPDDDRAIPRGCPRCNEPWVDPTRPSISAESEFTNLAVAVKQIRSMRAEACGFRLLLEFNEPE